MEKLLYGFYVYDYVIICIISLPSAQHLLRDCFQTFSLFIITAFGFLKISVGIIEVQLIGNNCQKLELIPHRTVI